MTSRGSHTDVAQQGGLHARSAPATQLQAAGGPFDSGPSLRGRTAGVVALVAIALGAIAFLAGAWSGIENQTIDLRFALRGASRPNDVIVVGIDDKSLSRLRTRWPFPRSLDARAIDRLHADRARAIVYDVQFTQPTSPSEDLALYKSVARAPGTILATSDIGPKGQTEVLGGDANLEAAHARAGAANFRANGSGAIQRYDYSIGGLPTLAVAGAERATGRAVDAADFEHGSAWIDFRGPPGTIDSLSFSDLIEGRIPASAIAGKVVVIGATSDVLQDVHSTSTTSSVPMSGPEVQANAIWTALHGNPLRSVPAWMTLICIALAGATAPLAERRLGALRAGTLAVIVGLAYALIVQIGFDGGSVLVLTYPLASLLVGSLGMVIVSYAAESWRRQLIARHAHLLERIVHLRTAELLATQREIVHRLARAAELRDEDTGHHVERIRSLCERLAMELGLDPRESERIGLASMLHDIGKLGVPDRVLLKRGAFDAQDWQAMRGHALAGASMLADSKSPLIQTAEIIARTHHERWDGNGYPAGLSGEQIPLAGRICAVCDVLDALLNERPYKPAWSFDATLARIARDSGTHFDPHVVAALQRLAPRLRSELVSSEGDSSSPLSGLEQQTALPV
jgi:CHASE2 domain-containing sensor protein